VGLRMRILVGKYQGLGELLRASDWHVTETLGFAPGFL